jgi:A-kinase anchor protein 18
MPTRHPTDDDSDADLVTDYLDASTLTATNTTSKAAAAAKLCTPTPTPNIKNYFVSTVDIKDKGLMSSSELGYANGTSGSGSNNHFNAGSNNNTITITTPSGHTTNNNNIIINNNCNMVPIISVTPHSPGAKYNSILEDSLSHLQSIRETVVQMKNSSAQNTNFGHIGIINPTVIAVIFGFFSSLLSLLNFPLFSSSLPSLAAFDIRSWHHQRFSTHVHHYQISASRMRSGWQLKTP